MTIAMADLTTTPIGALGQVSPEVAARWPADHEWPANDAPVLMWARFYVFRLGLRILPTPTQVDRIAHARYLSGEAAANYREDHGGVDAPQDVALGFWEDARALADAVRGPIPKLVHRHKDSDPTDADLVRWFSPLLGKANARATQHHLERGICCVLGVGHWWAPAQVDVDPRHGGDALGAYATLPGPHIRTPRGGVHVLVDARTARTHHSSNILAPGVEVRIAGFAMLPSGVSSPGRTVVDRSPPASPPAALLRPVVRPRPSAASHGGGAVVCADAWNPDAPIGRTAAILASPIGRGDGRTASLGVVVGLLAQARGAPDDVVDAALSLLVEYGTGRDWPATRIAEECARWRGLLTRGPRDAVFAAEVAATWIATRETGPSPKGTSWARAQARSMWKTANRRQEGQAGAEDMGHAGDVGERDAAAADADPWASSTTARPRLPDAHEALPPDPVCIAPDAVEEVDAMTPAPDATEVAAAVVSPVDEQAQRDAINEARLRRILPTIGQAYPLASMLRDLASTPVKVERLYPFSDFLTGKPEVREDTYEMEVGHGYGKWFGSALGGIREGDFKALGAGGAKGGKTHFLGQTVEGLALCTAARALGVPGYADAPLVMPVWVSEMPKEGEVLLRMISRHYGFDMAAIADGTTASEARGVVHMAEELRPLPASKIVQLASAILTRISQDERNPVGFAMQRIIREIDLAELPNPKGTGRQRIDYRSGPNLIGFMADAVAIYRRDLAALLGVAEDAILPLILLDPGQRFAGDSENSKAELDSLLGAVVARVCRRRSGLGAACIMTSDTTKAAARDLDLERFLSESGQRLAADIFAGSQAIMHHCDVYAVCGEEAHADLPFRRTQWVRVLQGRTGAPQEAYPFSWETHTGRFRPRKAEPLRTADPERGGGGGGGFGGGSRGRRRPPMFGIPAASPQVADHPHTGPRLPSYKGAKRHSDPKDD